MLADDQETVNGRHVVQKFDDRPGENAVQQGTLLCAVHQTERRKIAGQFGRGACLTSNSLSGLTGECTSQKGGIRSSADLRTFPQKVRSSI